MILGFSDPYETSLTWRAATFFSPFVTVSRSSRPLLARQGEKAAAELSHWHCPACADVPDEGTVAGLCEACHYRGFVENQGCYWCGPGVLATHQDGGGREVCLTCCYADDEPNDDYDSDGDD